MHGFQNRSSRAFNRRFGRTGSPWQSRYKAKFVGDQNSLDHLVLYVHLNPAKAGLVDDSAEYPFAGHREVNKNIRAPLVDADEMVLRFGTTQKAARRSYLGAIRAGTDPDSAEIDSHHERVTARRPRCGDWSLPLALSDGGKKGQPSPKY